MSTHPNHSERSSLSLSILPLTGDDDDDDEASIVSTLCIHTQRVRETKNVDGMHTVVHMDLRHNLI